MNPNWIEVDNLTPVSAVCPKCRKTFVIFEGDYEMFYDSELTDKIMKPLCCPGFWAVWKPSSPGWKFYFKTGGKPIGRDLYTDRSEPALVD